MNWLSLVTAFVGATVVPMDSPRVIPDQVVLVRGDRIVQVGPANTIDIPKGATRIDARGLFLMPGLADMHMHLLEGEAYFPLLLANGVTTVRHMASPPDVRALETKGPTIYTAGPILDGSPPVWQGSDIVITPDDAMRAVERQKRAGYDFLKVYDNLSRRARARARRAPVVDRALDRVLRVAPRLSVAISADRHQRPLHAPGALASDPSGSRELDRRIPDSGNCSRDGSRRHLERSNARGVA